VVTRIRFMIRPTYNNTMMDSSPIPSVTMLAVGTFLLCCASTSSSLHQPAFVSNNYLSQHRLPLQKRISITVRVNTHKGSSGSIESNSNDDDEIDHKEEDELTFKRMHGSYQIINHNDTSSVASHDEEDDEDDYGDVTDDIDKISWLPSLLSNKRRRRTHSRQTYTTRRENSHGDAYDSLDDINPQSIEILPVLPLPMVQHSTSFNNHNFFGNKNYDDDELTYASGVWAQGTENEMFASPAYLPHTSNHVLSIAEPRYKRLYDDLLQLGEYWGERRKEAIRNARRSGMDYVNEATLPNPEEKRRFIVTVMHPSEEGVLAEYGVLFQLKDLDEVAAIASYEDDDDGMISVDEIQGLMEDTDIDFSDVLLDTHYEASHDVVGIVKIHKIVNPECWDDEPEEEEYLMAEATMVDLMSDTKKKANKAEKLVPTTSSKRQRLIEADQVMSLARQRAATEVTDAVSRIRDELRSAVGEAFAKQHTSAVTTARKTKANNAGNSLSSSKNQIPLVPKGIFIERRSDESLLKEERELQNSFRKLVAIQQELKEKFRFTQGSIKSFGIGSMGLWLSTAAWSKFIDKRLEGANVEMQSELQGRLMEYLSETREENSENNEEQESTIDYDDLSPELQEEFTIVQAHAARELGPAALQRAIQIQRIIQAKNDAERLKLLKGCVDDERKRLEAKKMLRLALIDYKDDDRPPKRPTLTQKQARSAFEKLVKQDHDKRDDKLFPADAFQ